MGERRLAFYELFVDVFKAYFKVLNVYGVQD